MTPSDEFPRRVRVYGGRVVHALTSGTRDQVSVVGRDGEVTWVTTVTAETACGRHLDLGRSGESQKDGTLLPDTTAVTCKACTRKTGGS